MISLSAHLIPAVFFIFPAQIGAASRASSAPEKVPVTDMLIVSINGLIIRFAKPVSGGNILHTISVRWLLREIKLVREQSVKTADNKKTIVTAAAAAAVFIL